MAANAIKGKPLRWSWDLIAPFDLNQRAPLSRSAAWLTPALIASCVVLLLTFLHWPITAIVFALQFRSENRFTSGYDAALWLLQGAGLIVYLAAIAFSAANVWHAVRDRRGWLRVPLLLAMIVIFHFARSFGLTAMTIAYWRLSFDIGL